MTPINMENKSILNLLKEATKDDCRNRSQYKIKGIDVDFQIHNNKKTDRIHI